jgi:glutathione-independent formaldehyde dehydrogenase
VANNRGFVYLGPNRVEVGSIDYPKLENPRGKKIEHAVTLRVVWTNICGSDQHMVRGRTIAPQGLVLGHEITGEIIEKGKDVECLEIGDLVTVPFNVACGRCRTCREQQTGVCLNVNPSRAGGAYGYVDMGGWVGGQAEYVLIPYADFNQIKFPDKAQALEKIRDLTMLSDILPAGFHGAVSARVGVGSTVYVAGAGPVSLAAAASAQILGAAVVLMGDVNVQRLQHARSVGFVPIDLSKSKRLEDLTEAVLGVPEVDASIDAVGFEARGHGAQHTVEAPATVLNSLMTIAPAAGGIGIPGLYVTEDPGSKDPVAQHGSLSMRFGLGWAKSHGLYTGQTAVLRSNRALIQAILHNRLPIAKIVNATVIPLSDAPQGYRDFDAGAAKKFILDPHGLIKKAA